MHWISLSNMHPRQLTFNFAERLKKTVSWKWPFKTSMRLSVRGWDFDFKIEKHLMTIFTTVKRGGGGRWIFARFKKETKGELWGHFSIYWESHIPQHTLPIRHRPFFFFQFHTTTTVKATRWTTNKIRKPPYKSLHLIFHLTFSSSLLTQCHNQ